MCVCDGEWALAAIPMAAAAGSPLILPVCAPSGIEGRDADRGEGGIERGLVVLVGLLLTLGRLMGAHTGAFSEPSVFISQREIFDDAERHVSHNDNEPGK